MHSHEPVVDYTEAFHSNAHHIIINNNILPFFCNIHDGPASFILQDGKRKTICTNYVAVHLANKNNESEIACSYPRS